MLHRQRSVGSAAAPPCLLGCITCFPSERGPGRARSSASTGAEVWMRSWARRTTCPPRYVHPASRARTGVLLYAAGARGANARSFERTGDRTSDRAGKRASDRACHRACHRAGTHAERAFRQSYANSMRLASMRTSYALTEAQAGTGRGKIGTDQSYQYPWA